MTNNPNSHNVAVIAGDVTMDWNIARLRRANATGSAWNADSWTRACLQRGGAALLLDLVKLIARQLSRQRQGDFQIRSFPDKKIPVRPGDPRFHHSYAMWSLFKYSEQQKGAKEKPAWRVEEFLGLDLCPDAGSATSRERQMIVNDTPDADLIILDDANLGFRDHEELWPAALKDPQRRPWIILKMARPVAEGKLWERLHRDFSDRLIVLMPVNDLRLTEVQISRELSWESAAQDLAWELVYNPRVNGLSHCAHVVISFDTAGAVLLSRQNQPQDNTAEKPLPKCFLFFDPAVIEGTWAQNYHGNMVGYTSCLVGAVARELMRGQDQADIHRAIQSGLTAMRKLHLEGYCRRDTKILDVQLAYPSEMIAEELAREKIPFAVAEVRHPIDKSQGDTRLLDVTPGSGYWTILQDRYVESLDKVAERVVIEGIDSALSGVPVGRFGFLVTVDRQEIESLRSIRSLIAEYCSKPQKRPLSIAVFGPPGSGKSFTVEQVANSARPGEIEVKSFNLSQFARPEELLGALHQVRDITLSGKVPLVFWDEFDTKLGEAPLGWLRYFLAPMQDGSFQEGQITHPIGRCIFVFAGGTSDRLDRFIQNEEKYPDAKVPDFVSRLRGFVNILGPDRRASSGESAPDLYYVIRRAILLRSLFSRNAPQLFYMRDGKEILNIDSGVLRALLGIEEYKHGVRSMESLISMSLLTDKSRFERSCLPAQAQLELHVNGLGFLALVRQIELTGDQLETLAEAAHDVYCAGKRRDGWVYGPIKSLPDKPECWLINEEDIKDPTSLLIKLRFGTESVSEYLLGKLSNETSAALSGYDGAGELANELVSAVVADLNDALRAERFYDQPCFATIEMTDEIRKLTESKVEGVDLIRLNRRLLEQAYPAEITRRVLTHPLLVSYGELPKEYKEANRVTVRAIPKKLARAGYVMIPARSYDPPFSFPGADLEMLACYEHELWMDAKLAEGWKLGTPTPENPKRNEYLVEWNQVPEEVKEIDRDLIKGIPQILARAGYTIVRVTKEIPGDETGQVLAAG
jgi:hypothetical protein